MNLHSALSARHLLLLFVLTFAGAATLFATTPRGAAAEEKTGDEPADARYYVQICKEYQQVGSPGATDRTFAFDVSLSDIEDAPGTVSTLSHTITLDEGQVKCLPTSIGIRPKATVTVTERLDLTPSFTSAESYPRVSFEQNGPVAADVPADSWTFELDEHCSQASPCVVTFHNRQPGISFVPITANPVSVRICKHHLDNSDGSKRPATEFKFLVNGGWHAISVAEGEAACATVPVLLSNLNNPINIIEALPEGWTNAPGYPRRKVDSFPAMSSPDQGSFGSVITVKVNNGCSAGFDPLTNPLPVFGKQVQGLAADDTLCTVYFFNQESASQSCIDCDPPLCARGEPCEPSGCQCEPPLCMRGEPCEPSPCQNGAGCGPVCRVVGCNTPACLTDCDPPQQCLVDCDPFICTVGCDEPGTPVADPPTTSPDPETPTPQSDVQGEITPRPQPTPIAPNTGAGMRDAGANVSLLAVFGIAILIASCLMTTAAFSRKE